MYVYVCVCANKTCGAGEDILARCLFFTFSISNPFFGLNCSNKVALPRAHRKVLNDMYHENLVPVGVLSERDPNAIGPW